MPVINATNSVKAGIQKNLADSWRQKYPLLEDQLKLMCNFLPYVSIRNATYVFKESVPFPMPWAYGTGRTAQTFKDVSISLALYPYQVKIPYNIFDREDDQLGDMKTHVATVVDRFLQLPDKLMAEYLNASRSLNPALATCYDGVSLFSATDGDGNNRFGVSGGNIYNGTGAVNVAAFIHDLYGVQRRFQQMLDPASQVIYSAADIDYTKLHVIYPPSYNEVVRDASKAALLRTDTANQVSQSNTLISTFVPHCNPYLSDTSEWFAVVEHPYFKTFAYRAPQTVRQAWAELNNSDIAREENKEVFYGDVRVAIGPWLPFTIIKVNY